MRGWMRWLPGAAGIMIGLSAAEGKGGPLKPEPLFADTARTLAISLMREHVSNAKVDDTISKRTFENYIEAIDPLRIYFLASDIEAFKLQETKLDDAMLAGDCTFAFQVYTTLVERVRNRVAFVDERVKRGFSMDRTDSYRWNRKDAPWAADPAAWDNLWDQVLHNQYVQMAVSRKIAEEQKELEKAKAATNAPPAAAQTDSTNPPPPAATAPLASTNAPAGGATNAVVKAAKPPPTPEETITKQFHQLLNVLDDSDSESVFQRFLTAFAMAYDPHCSYMAPSTEENFDISMKLSLVGIGALLSPEDGALKIEKILPGGPADRDKRASRLQEDDKIIAVAQGDGEAVDILHWPMNKAIALIRGEKGTRVVLTVVPASDPTGASTKAVDLVRDEIKLEEQAAKHALRNVPDSGGKTNTLGVITLPSFYADLKAAKDKPDEYRSCARDMEVILKTLSTQHVAGVLLDLRNNGGGSLREVAIMTGLFIKSGPVVQVRQENRISLLPDPDPTVAYAGPLVVLVNRLSASASEILAAALQDYGRAIVIGDSQTYGKGTVQAVHKLGPEDKMGAIKVTNALFYRINGSSTQLRGVSSDIVIPSFFDDQELGESYKDNAVPWSMVPALRYQGLGDLYPAVAILGEKARARWNHSREFGIYTNVLTSVKVMNKVEELPLGFAPRLEQQRARQKLADMQKEIAGNGDEEAGGAKATAPARHDIVLEEALKLLADFVALQTS